MQKGQLLHIHGSYGSTISMVILFLCKRVGSFRYYHTEKETNILLNVEKLVVILNQHPFRQHVWKCLLIGTPLSPPSMCTLQALMNTEISLPKL